MTPEFITIAIADAITELYQVEASKFEISPADPEHGDFASNVAFGLAKSVGAAPIEIATKIAAVLKHDMLAEAWRLLLASLISGLAMTTGKSNWARLHRNTAKVRWGLARRFK